MLGEGTTSVYIYFLGGGSVLALGLGKFNAPQEQVRSEQIQIGDFTYNVKTQGFDTSKDMFPPIQRTAGFSSKVARKIADTYVVAKQWDKRNLKIGQRTADLAKLAKEKWQEFDAKYQVHEKVDNASKTTVDAVKVIHSSLSLFFKDYFYYQYIKNAFDEKHQITRRLSETAKSIDEKFEISSTVQSQVEKIKTNEKVQQVSTKVSQIVKTGLDTIEQITKETQQLVTEKEAHGQLGEKKEETSLHPTNEVDLSTLASATENTSETQAASGNTKDAQPDTESQV
ncbi:hypothetical protein RFI_08896 [Reticulomyxa filosa]|uniref:Uncharacterized protein n=1 Tax=Reticulomyxa filosa TaxID=46433 RepID=X6NSC1_RETFI|nr:hypothetical protein RFI_08896 [Reticulomyxa filosa]|eukprot:ETO28237.1 hypothetical protein RFI_08896 [Reticulomyxa filosa]